MRDITEELLCQEKEKRKRRTKCFLRDAYTGEFCAANPKVIEILILLQSVK